MQSVDSDVPLLLGEFGTFRDIAFRNISRRVVGMTLGFVGGKRRSSVKVNFKYRGQRREIILRDLAICDGRGRNLLRTVYSRDSERQTVESIAGIDQELVRSLLKNPIRLFHFLPAIMQIRWELDRLGGEKKIGFSYLRSLHTIDDTSRLARRLLTSLQYLGPFREVPLRVYPFSGERPSLLEPTGRGATDILVADYFRRGTRKRQLTNTVRDWLCKAGVAKDLSIRALSDRHYEIRVQHPRTGEYESLADVGYGISQVLPVVVAGYSLDPGELFIVEQPELHLHPRAQAELGDFFLELYRRKVQCIVETHSEHLIMRLQRHVASGRIVPEELTVNYVAAGNLAKEVTKLPLNRDGIFERNWPEGFFEERLEEALELARAPLKRGGKVE
jgi:hypothetical protein